MSISFPKRTTFGLFFLFSLFLVTFYLLPINVYALTESEIQAQEAIWRSELAQTEEEIAKWQIELDNTKKGTASLQNDARLLQAKINEAKAFIKKREIQIQQLTVGINDKTRVISDLEQKIDRGRESLASIIRSTNEIDSFSLPEAILSNRDISDFFQDLDSYDTLKKSLAEEFAGIRALQATTESERKALAQKRTEEADTKAKVEEDKKRIERDEEEKQQLIKINKTKEKSYEQVIAEKQKRAAQIRAALFSLRDTAAIPFGDALRYANEASAKTSIRPAFILAIITQESDLGKNQGSCLLSSLESGDGVGKNTGTFFEKVMKAPRDTAPFSSITGRLGRDWKVTPVSCPPGTVYTSSRGYGGGMGPSQFIPSTWELFKQRIASAISISADSADPWNPEHSFMATAIYLSDLGAAGGGYSAERNAACRYYSGRSCDSKRPANSFYGNQVMAKAQDIQVNMIEPLEGF